MESKNFDLFCRMDELESSDGSFMSINYSYAEEDEMDVQNTEFPPPPALIVTETIKRINTTFNKTRRSGNNSDSEENETDSDLDEHTRRSGNNSDSEENETNSDLDEHGSGIDSYQKKILQNKREQQKFLRLIHLDKAKQDFNTAANKLMTKKKKSIKPVKKVYDGPLRKSERYKDKERKNLCLNRMFAYAFLLNTEDRRYTRSTRASSKMKRKFDSDDSTSESDNSTSGSYDFTSGSDDSTSESDDYTSEDMSDDELHVLAHKDCKDVRRSSRLKDVNTNYSLDALFNHLYGPSEVKRSESTRFHEKMTSNKKKHFKSMRNYKTEEIKMAERKVKEKIEMFDIKRIESSEWPKVLVRRLPRKGLPSVKVNLKKHSTRNIR